MVFFFFPIVAEDDEKERPALPIADQSGLSFYELRFKKPEIFKP